MSTLPGAQAWRTALPCAILPAWPGATLERPAGAPIALSKSLPRQAQFKMPPAFRRPPVKSAAELAAEKSTEDAELAETLDNDPEEPGAEPDNLTVVETKIRPTEPYSHPLLRLTLEHINKMNRVELLALGHDRAYWKRGVSMLSFAQLREKFIEAQLADTTLHDEPAAASI